MDFLEKVLSSSEKSREKELGEASATDISFGKRDIPSEILIPSVLGSKREILAERFFKPYFYLKGGALPENPSANGILLAETVKRTLFGKEEEFLRISVDSPSRVPELREKLHGKAFEADIPFLRRYCIDNGIFFFKGRAPSILSFDIEVFSPTLALPDPKKDEILLISYAFSPSSVDLGKKEESGVLSSIQNPGRAQKFVKTLGSEKELLEEFFSVVRRLDPDIVLGYNSDSFDFPYVSERAKRNGIVPGIGIDSSALSFRKKGRLGGLVPEIFGRQIIDIYLFVRYIISHDPSFRAKTLDLDSVGNEIFGEGKVPFEFESLPQLLKKRELETFFEYSLKDAVLTLRLAEKFVPLALELSRLLSIPPSEVSRMTSGQIVEGFLVRESFLSKRVVPNRPSAELSEERDEQRFEGAFVREPKKGLHENVVACDFRSLYPSIIISHNIDPDTFGECECCPKNVSPTGDRFCLKRFGLVPESLKRIVRERAGLKKALKSEAPGTQEHISLNARQAALKLVANSFYGYLAYQNSRWYSFEGARSTAAWGRKYITDTIAFAEEKGFSVIYGDTDSLFFSSPGKSREEFEKSAKEFVSIVNSRLPGEMELELQDFYSRGVFLTKKRYAVITPEGRIVIKGLERIRRDWAGIARRTQEEVLLAILRDGSPDKAKKIISSAVQALRSKKVSIDDITIYTQLTKKPGQYKLTSPHVEAAKLGKAPAKAGTVVRFGIVKGKGIVSHRARPIEQVTLENYDPEYYIENQVLPAVTRIMDAVGLGEDDFKDQKSLSGFF